MNNKTNVNIEIGGPCFLLFLVFLILKLCKVITWSWWWVTAPLWIPLALFLAILVIILIVAGIGKVFEKIGDVRWNRDYNKRHKNR
jgi:phosphoglycerol transferase MdoB-like AlkP superfamily enzyme